MLAFGGAWEFAPPRHDPPHTNRANALTQAYAALDYDAGLLAPEEIDYLHRGGVEPPAPFIAPDGPVGLTFSTPGGLVGLVLTPHTEHPETIFDDVLREAGRLSNEVDLVVVATPWGVDAEQELLKTSDGQFHILWGTGPGPGVAGKLARENTVLWTRPYDEGKAVQRIEVLAWPHGEGFRWSEDTIRSTVVPLKDDVEADPEMDALLERARE